MEKIKRWLTFKLVQIAAQLDGELFMRLCEIAVMAKYLAQMDPKDIERLEQEHDYEYNNEKEQDHDTMH